MKDSMRRSLFWLAGIGLALSACSPQATYPVPVSGPYPPPGLAHRVASPQIEVYWNCSQPEPGLLQVDGVVHNIGGQTAQYTKIEIAGVGSTGGTVADASASPPNAQLQTNETSPFRLSLRTAGGEARFDLYYQYYLGSMSDLHRFYVRDACSPTQHLAR